MKIAVCLSGHTRNYLYNYPNFYFDADVFISTVEQSGLPPNTGLPYVSYHSQEYRNTATINKDDIIKKYTPTLFTISDDRVINPELVNKFHDTKTTDGALLTQIGMMFYRLYEANNLKKEWEIYNKFTYDYVIRSRFDLKINYLEFNTSKIQLWKDANSMCDLFFASDSHTMNRICNVYSWFMIQPLEMLKQFKNAEHILKYYFDLLKISHPTDTNFDISFTKDYPIQKLDIKYGEKIITYGK